MTRMHMEQEAFDAPAEEASPNLLWIAWRRKSLILFGAVVGLILGALYYAQRPPVYQSSLRLLVIKKRPDILPIPGEDPRLSYYEDFLSTHMLLLRSPVIIDRAAKQPQLRSLKTFAGQSDPTGLLIGALSVSRDASKDQFGNYINTNILSLSFRGSVAEDCGTILHLVADSYKDFLEEIYRSGSKDTVQLITRAKDVLTNQLEEKEAAYRDFRLKTHFLRRGKDGANVHQERLTNIESRRSALLVRQAELQGRLNAVENAVKNGASAADILAIASEPSSRVLAEKDRTGPKSAAEDPLLMSLLQQQIQLADYGPEHPQVEAMRKRLQVTRDFLANPPPLRSPTTAKTGKAEDTPVDAVELYTRFLQQELQGVKVAVQALSELFEREYNEAREMIKDEIQDEIFRSDITRTQQLYDTIIKRLQELDLGRDLGGYEAQVIAPAGSGWQVEPRASPIFSVAIFLGVLAGLGMAFLAEVSDKSFRTPEEIRRRLGLPVVGQIPQMQLDPRAIQEMESNGLALDPILCTYYHSQSTEAEAVRAVRTALYFSTQGKGHTVIQITSPNPGDGKTTVAANLAISIAQSGKRTLLIDADFRKPRLHQLFGISVKAGVESVLAGEVEASAVIQPSAIAGLSLLPCGPLPPNPAELLTSPRFEAMLKSIREQYDFVLIDTPPLLVVTDPSVVAHRVDGVLLVVRTSKNGRPDAERAKEILSTLGANVLGVVVNGMSRHPKYGYYSYRDYGYHSNSNTGAVSQETGGDTPGAATENGASDNLSGSGVPERHRQLAGKRHAHRWHHGIWGRLFGRR